MKRALFVFACFTSIILSVEADAQTKCTLSECLEIALRQNADILNAQQQIRLQEGVVVEAHGKRGPKATLSSNYQRIDKEKLPSFAGRQFGSPDSWSLELEVNQPLYSGGSNSANEERAHLQQKAAPLEYEQVINDVLLMVRERFYDVLLTRSQIEVQEETIKLLHDELANSKKQFQAGSVPEFNVIRADVAVANSKPALISAKNGYTLALEELSRVLSLTPEQRPIEIQGEMTVEPFPLDLPSLLAAASENRPEPKRLQLLIQAEGQGVHIAEAGYRPSVNLFANYGTQKDQFSDSLTDEVHGWSAGMRAQWNIFDSHETAGRVAQAEAQQAATSTTYAQTLKNIEVEVRQAYSRLQEVKELLGASEKVIDQAKESVRLANARTGVGAATQLDVLNAQVSLSQARMNRVKALHDYNSAVAQIKRATSTAQ